VSVYIPVELQRKIRKQFAGCCAYCRTAEMLTVVTFEFEHIVPRSSGGETMLENLCFACPSCNRFKANHTTARDSVSDQDVPLFHPQQDVWSEHFSWVEGGTQIGGLTAVGRATVALLRMNRPQLVRVRRMWTVMGEHPPHIDIDGLN
jgi:hypothetical protein